MIKGLQNIIDEHSHHFSLSSKELDATMLFLQEFFSAPHTIQLFVTVVQLQRLKRKRDG